MGFCSACGAQMLDGALTCAACGKSATSPAVAVATTGGMSNNVAGMLAYFLFPALVFLLLEPYNKNRFIRFHSFQSIFLAAASLVLSIALGMFSQVLFFLMFLVWPLVGVGEFILWIVLLIKAYQGQMFKVPFIGDIAEKQANLV